MPAAAQRASADLFFVHGFLDAGAIWDGVIAELKDQVRSVAATDLAGMGGRAREAGPFTLERFAADVGRDLETVGRPVVLVGQSMGAQVAELVAAKWPQRVAGLVLLTPVPLAGPQLPAEALQPFRSLGGQPENQRAVRRHLSFALDDQQLALLGALGDLAAPDAVAASADAWNAGHPDGRQASRFQGPVLVVRGAQDGFVTPEVVAAGVAPRFNAPTLAVVEQAGHWPHVEQPQAVAQLLLQFIDSLPSRHPAPGTR